MASNEISVKLTAENKISAKLEQIVASIQHIEKTVTGTVAKVNTATGNATNGVTKMKLEVSKLRAEIDKTSNSVSNLNSGLNNLFKGYVGFKGFEFLTDKVDETISTVNRLNYVNYQIQKESGVPTEELFDPTTGKYTAQISGMTQETMDKIFSASQRVRGSYSGMLKDVSRLTVLAGDAFDNNIDNAIRFQEIMTEAYTIGGASAQEMHSSMYQLVQALGSGRLQGDELRSMIEGAPLASKAIEKFAQKLYKTDKPLKEMASQGMITAKVVTNAILSSAGELDEAFAMTSVTFGQTMDMISSYATKAFEPVFIKLGEFLSSDFGGKLVSELESVISTVANSLNLLISMLIAIDKMFPRLTEGIIEFVKYLALALGVLTTIWATNQFLGSLGGMFKFISKIPIPFKILLGIILALGVAFSFFKKDIEAFLNYVPSGIELIGALVTALSLAFVALGIVAFMSGNSMLMAIAPVLVAIGVVIAIIGLLAYAFVTNAQYIVGFISGAITFVLNIFKFLVRNIIGIIMLIMSPIVTMIELITSFWNDGWDGMKKTLNTILKDMSNKILDFALVATRLLDKVFHTDFSSGLEARKSAIKEWAKEAEVETSISAYGQIDKAVTESFAYGSLSESYQKGAKKGEEISHTITTNADELRNKLFDKLNAVGNKLNVSRDINQDVALNTTSMDTLLGNIDDNTKKTADNTSLSEDDVKYLRDLAELEWKKEFTTASIQIDMNNVNNISNEMDLDGIVTYLTDALYEQAEQFTDGVYI